MSMIPSPESKNNIALITRVHPMSGTSDLINEIPNNKKSIGRITMEKDAYYFPHFCNARHDRKIRRLRKELGAEGYGIFFMILEVLREQIDFTYPMEDIDLLAEEFSVSEQKLRTVISNYQLFEIDEKQQFFSPKLLLYLEPYLKSREEKREAGRLGGLKSAEIRASKIQALLQAPLKQNEPNETKVNETKVNEIYNIYPTSDINNNDRPTHKCSKNKKQIERLILNKTYDVVYTVLSGYVKECDDKKVWLKDFTTLLNQFPDENTYKPEKSDDSYKPKPVEYIPMTQEQKEEARKNIEKAFGNNKAEKPDIDTNLEGIDESL